VSWLAIRGWLIGAAAAALALLGALIRAGGRRAAEREQAARDAQGAREMHGRVDHADADVPDDADDARRRLRERAARPRG
jgi:hypothetical protein